MTEPNPPAAGGGARGFAALRSRDFRLLIFGKVFSWIGLHMLMVAIGVNVAASHVRT